MLTWGPGNIDQDPLFANAHLVLAPTSPCIDAGDNDGIGTDRSDVDDDGDFDEPVPLDVLRQPRRVDLPAVPDTGNGTPPVVDMGATERQ